MRSVSCSVTPNRTSMVLGDVTTHRKLNPRRYSETLTNRAPDKSSGSSTNWLRGTSWTGYLRPPYNYGLFKNLLNEYIYHFKNHNLSQILDLCRNQQFGTQNFENILKKHDLNLHIFWNLSKMQDLDLHIFEIISKIQDLDLHIFEILSKIQDLDII